MSTAFVLQVGFLGTAWCDSRIVVSTAFVLQVLRGATVGYSIYSVLRSWCCCARLASESDIRKLKTSVECVIILLPPEFS